jgi:pimeloyl-ACP methyl ester carboxylesterase
MKIQGLKALILIVSGLMTFNVFAHGNQTTINQGITVYSEYYPNFKTKFKGTIIFENGSGMGVEQWTQSKKFISCAKKQGSLFFYDRNGLGKSLPDLNTSTSNPIKAAMVSEKLMKLLERMHLPKPYIVVGHSFGGLYVDYFARRYPNQVKGIVLVDPTPQNLQYSKEFLKQDAQFKHKLGDIPSLEMYKKYTYAESKKSNFKIPSAEVFYMGIAKTREQIQKLSPLPNTIPIILISSSQMEHHNPMVGSWFKQQKQYLNKNPNSKAYMVNASHSIWIEKPEIVCEQIKKLAQEN